MGIMTSFTQSVQYPICLKCDTYDRTFPRLSILQNCGIFRHLTCWPLIHLCFSLPRARCCGWKTTAPASRHLKCLSMRPYSTWTLHYPAAPLQRRSVCLPSPPCWGASKAASRTSLSCSVTPHDPQTSRASPTTSYRSVWIHCSMFVAIRDGHFKQM